MLVVVCRGFKALCILGSYAVLFFSSHPAWSVTCHQVFTFEKSISISPTRNALRRALYRVGIVSSSAESLAMGNKLYAARKLRESLPAQFQKHISKSFGLKEFLEKVGKGKLELVLAEEFPNGFVVKTVTGMDSSGFGMMTNIPELKDFLESKEADLGTLQKETYLIEEMHPGTLFGRDVHAEYRIHTLGDRVVPGATLARWSYWLPNNPKVIEPLESSLNKFLKAMPSEMTKGQAWSFDVVVVGNSWKLIEINTNMGKDGNWSGFLSDPKVTSAYGRHLGIFYGWRFGRIASMLFKENLANYEAYVRKELIATEAETFKSDKLRIEEMQIILWQLVEKTRVASEKYKGAPHHRLVRAHFWVKNIWRSMKRSKEIGDKHWNQAKIDSGIKDEY